MPFSNQIARFALPAALISAACWAADSTNPTQDAKAKTADELRNSIVLLNSRIEALENKIAALNDKLEAAKAVQAKAEAKAEAAKSDSSKTEDARTTAVSKHPVDTYEAPVAVATAKSDPEGGFVNDEAVQTYRKAMVYYQSNKFSDAAMVFSTFVEKFPDHPLAGSAQFFVGDSYFKQKEYKLALVEFKKVLTSYDRSAQVAQTLHQMAEAEDALKHPEEAARHRQLLLSLFPQSPASLFQQAKNDAPAQSGAAAPDHPVPAQPATGTPAPGGGASIGISTSTNQSAAPAAPAPAAPGTESLAPPTAPIGSVQETSE